MAIKKEDKNTSPILHLHSYMEGDSGEMIPLLSTEEEEEMHKEDTPDVLPILPVRNTVLFPGVVLPITVGRQKSIRLVKKAYRSDRVIGVVAQKNNNNEEPSKDDIYTVGTVAKILKMLILPDGNTTIIIQGQKRFEIQEIIQEDPYITAKVNVLSENFADLKKKEIKALVQSLKDNATKILRLNPEIPQDAQLALNNIESPSFLTHFLCSNINADIIDKQELLETNDGIERATKLLEFMLKEIQMLELKHEITNKVHSDLDQQQRDYFLRHQIKVLQDELGGEASDKEFVDNLRKKASKKKWPDAVNKHFLKELLKAERLSAMAPDYAGTVNYLELLVDLPWFEYTKDSFDLVKARKILDADHFGLEKVKDRIIEYIAVLKLKNNMKAPILCLLGPPGVGKTSLGKSIAKALHRKYVRMSLGGVRDEAEVRGHRKTYIGAMPGKIIQNIKKAQYGNPVFVLDELDKIGSDFRGDPASALLEVLDPEQNNAFVDNYLEVDYDLSKILFLATANSLDTIHPALRDRMEVIEVTGYTMEEKVQIAVKYLVPKQKKEHGLKLTDVILSNKIIVKIIEDYTRESGVRNLERKIGGVMRRIAKKIATDEVFEKNLTAVDIVTFLGIEDFDKEIYDDNATAGVVTGLAWTQVGGEILFIESSLSKGKGKVTISGQLGDVMKESVGAALSYLKANSDALEIDYRVFDNFDLHLHVPAGAVPKDGPSAGITMLTSLASIYTQRKVKNKLAMTGEITLRGKVLPVGGIKEKILAAKRAGIKEIILSKKNKKDIEEINKSYVEDLIFHFVEHVEEVLTIALLKEKVDKPFDLTIKEPTPVPPSIIQTL